MTTHISCGTLHFARGECLSKISGVYNIEVPPVPIPNTVVKLNCAENTWRAAARENRSSPESETHLEKGVFFLFVGVDLIRCRAGCRGGLLFLNERRQPCDKLCAKLFTDSAGFNRWRKMKKFEITENIEKFF